MIISMDTYKPEVREKQTKPKQNLLFRIKKAPPPPTKTNEQKTPKKVPEDTAQISYGS